MNRIQRLPHHITDGIQFAHLVHEMVTERFLRLGQRQLKQGGNRLFQVAELGAEGEQAFGTANVLKTQSRSAGGTAPTYNMFAGAFLNKSQNSQIRSAS
jgi:hypothetical protein